MLSLELEAVIVEAVVLPWKRLVSVPMIVVIIIIGGVNICFEAH